MKATSDEKAETAAPAPEKAKPTTKPARAVKVKPARKARAVAKAKAEKKPARAPKAKGRAAKKKPRAKVRARPVRETRRTARKAKAVRAPRGQGPIIIKKVIQSADAVSLKVLVEGVKQGTVEARRHLDRLVAKAQESIGARALELIGDLGLTATAAGELAFRVAELEQQKGGGNGRLPVEVHLELDGHDYTVLCIDEGSAEVVRRLADQLEEPSEVAA